MSLCGLVTRTLISIVAVVVLYYQLNSMRNVVHVNDVFKNPTSENTHNYQIFPRKLIKSNDIMMDVVVLEKSTTTTRANTSDSNTKNPLVLFLHGFPQTATTSWYFQLLYFMNNDYKFGGQSYTVMAPDLRGYNGTEKPDVNNLANYDIGEFVHDVKGLIDGYYGNNEAHNRKAVVVAHDWGAVIAWALASTYPQVVEKLIILNVPHPSTLTKTITTLPVNRIFAQLRKSWYIFFMQLGFSIPEEYFSREGFKKLSFAFASLAKQNILSIEDYHYIVSAWSQPNCLQGMIAYYRGFLTGKVSNYLKMKLFGMKDQRRYPMVGNTMDGPLENQTVKVPTLILWGKDDIALIEETADLSFKYFVDESVKSKSKLQKFDAGHFVMLEIPNKINEEIEKFISNRD
ncbi:hypothetical protein C9374_005711 [Naegleria lovaniensis]|uniref:AB hydrolase-1 domain-containing protein n=1 Tax=Naegleria lovaniensis TaxID=51637 RepID=A0AA88KHL6_NAELO|nr:uncharacterized protein C9374_005711 [Naegleria lovaniensis]KAG2381919.1 hypothetical protein C9374_005711 [Naegleria lovaniensis]